MNETPLPYQAIVEQLSDALIYADAEGLIRAWNAGSEALFGFTREAALGRSLDIIIPEHLREAHWRGFHAAIAAGATRGGGKPARTRAIHASGERIYAEVSFSVVIDATTGQRGAVAIARPAAPPVRPG